MVPRSQILCHWIISDRAARLQATATWPPHFRRNHHKTAKFNVIEEAVASAVAAVAAVAVRVGPWAAQERTFAVFSHRPPFPRRHLRCLRSLVCVGWELAARAGVSKALRAKWNTLAPGVFQTALDKHRVVHCCAPCACTDPPFDDCSRPAKRPSSCWVNSSYSSSLVKWQGSLRSSYCVLRKQERQEAGVVHPLGLWSPNAS